MPQGRVISFYHFVTRHSLEVPGKRYLAYNNDQGSRTYYETCANMCKNVA